MKDLNFGPLLEFNDNYLVSYNEEVLYILDPETLVAIAAIDEFRRFLCFFFFKFCVIHVLMLCDNSHFLTKI